MVAYRESHVLELIEEGLAVMLAIALGSLVLSSLMSFLIGHAVIVERDSFLRKKFGLLLLVGGAFSFVLLPPQLTSMDAALEPVSNQLGSLASGLAWPATLGKQTYLVLWVISSLAALLIGMQIWNARKPGWRPGNNSNAFDTSATGRARGLLPMADSLEDALDTLRRTGLDAGSVPKLAEELRTVGRRFSASMPDGSGAVYSLVVTALPTGGLAPVVTRYLLEGAETGGQSANPEVRQ